MSTEPYAEAVAQLRAIVDEAGRREVSEPGAAALATASATGRPSVRMVSIAAIEEAGLLFFTDIRGGKGRQITENPDVALCFHWPELRQQVTVDGRAEILEVTDSDRHWARRPRDFQLAAWVNEGPAAPDEDAGPHDLVREVRRRFEHVAVPRPPHWHAVRLHPTELRFWKPGWRNLHARVRYVRDERGSWHREIARPF